eukprot:scaffold37374_cov161-Skeletonema_dohrnii-CCMP3373.AAC.5
MERNDTNQETNSINQILPTASAAAFGRGRYCNDSGGNSQVNIMKMQSKIVSMKEVEEADDFADNDYDSDDDDSLTS